MTNTHNVDEIVAELQTDLSAHHCRCCDLGKRFNDNPEVKKLLTQKLNQAREQGFRDGVNKAKQTIKEMVDAREAERTYAEYRNKSLKEQETK